ncbi:hypothetical protein LJC58_04680, partial [Lachnospiraceae bacterium OttesenSCG-928-D06]|nr:hypothetical protein [Lachnospiraceae bacterium OttesenSCG-928-D06]
MEYKISEVFYNCEQKFYIISGKTEYIYISNRHDVVIDISDNRRIEFIDKRRAFADRHPNFICALLKQKIGKSNEICIPFIFYKLEEGWQRVGIEKTECTMCEWNGNIANPTLPDLYLMIPDRFELMRKSLELNQVTCPKCNNKLKRFAIWVDQP